MRFDRVTPDSALKNTALRETGLVFTLTNCVAFLARTKAGPVGAFSHVLALAFLRVIHLPTSKRRRKTANRTITDVMSLSQCQPFTSYRSVLSTCMA